MYTSIDKKFEYFENRLSNLYKNSFPLRTKVVSEKRLNKPWISTAILNSIRTKSNYFKLFKQGIIDKRKNDDYKRILTKTIRTAKRKYFHNYFELNMNNIKKTWEGMNRLMGKSKVRSTVKSITVDNVKVTESQKIAHSFNDYFSTVAEKLEADLPQSNYVPIRPLNSPTNSFFLYPVSPDECIKIISSLNNTTYGINNISTKLLKSVKDLIAFPLCELINSSFSNGVFPNI